MKVFASGNCVLRQLLAPGFGRPAALRFSSAIFFFIALLFGRGDFGKIQAQEHGSDDGLTAKVLALETLWNQAELAKDTQSLDHLLADTFLYVDIDGSSIRNKADFIHSVTERAEHIESIRSESMLSRVYGDTVIVTGVYHEKGTLKGKPYYHHGRFTDTWVKQGSGWMCAASQSTLIQK